MDFLNRIKSLNEEMLAEIRKIINESEGKRILIPFFYDEDLVDDDIQRLVEDGYEVYEGYSGDNFSINLETYANKEVDVIGVSLGTHWDDNAVVVIDKYQYTYDISIYENPYLINYLLEKLKTM